jgi:hypothetical protein
MKGAVAGRQITISSRNADPLRLLEPAAAPARPFGSGPAPQESFDHTTADQAAPITAQLPACATTYRDRLRLEARRNGTPPVAPQRNSQKQLNSWQRCFARRYERAARRCPHRCVRRGARGYSIAPASGLHRQSRAWLSSTGCGARSCNRCAAPSRASTSSPTHTHTHTHTQHFPNHSGRTLTPFRRAGDPAASPAKQPLDGH